MYVILIILTFHVLNKSCKTPLQSILFFSLFFFNYTATTEIYTLSLHDALPIFGLPVNQCIQKFLPICDAVQAAHKRGILDRKSTRLNSSHGYISYAVFCLKKKK